MDIAAAKAALTHLDLDDNPAAVRAKSRDFFWYSPVLKDRLDHLSADFVVMPKTQDEVIEVLAACHAHDVPVTVRGSGTGNYGQAMPLAGGCVLHMQNMDKVLEISPGRVVTQPGTIIRELDRITRDQSGQELRMFPSTAGTATIGGFICGGSGGVGSVRWGMLRDYGNILRIRVATMEARPRILDFTGRDLARVSHAYGDPNLLIRRILLLSRLGHAQQALALARYTASSFWLYAPGLVKQFPAQAALAGLSAAQTAPLLEALKQAPVLRRVVVPVNH